jgi:hypothetical protein
MSGPALLLVLVLRCHFLSIPPIIGKNLERSWERPAGGIQLSKDPGAIRSVLFTGYYF